MNLLILHTHDMGRYNSVYGYAAQTPEMMKLAQEGVSFRNAHCAAPTCSPSRAAMLTGETAHQSGMLGLLHRGFQLNEPHRHLAVWLGANGYETARAGVQHELEHPKEHETYQKTYDDLEKNPAKRDRITTENAIDFINAEHDKPWFLWVGFFLPHRGFLKADPAVADPRYVKVPEILPDTSRIRQDMADYYTSVAFIDQLIGRILDAVKSAGGEGDTLVLLTTDHGIAFPFMKCRLTSHGTGVTLVIKHPTLATGGLVCDSLVSHLDVFPSVCDLLGVARPDWLVGQSLRPLLANGEGKIRTDLFAEVNVHAAEEPMRAVRTADHLYIKLIDEDMRPPLANMDPGYSKTEILETTDWRITPREREQLYDLKLDPLEVRNVVDDPRYKDVLNDMRHRLKQWMVRTNDPLESGKLQIPEGATVNTRESLNAGDGHYR